MSFKTLGDVCTFENGDRGKNYPSKGTFVSEGIPFINAGNLKNSLIDTSSLQFISTERFNLLSNGKVKENDILFCLRGSLGKFAIVKGIKTGAIASSLIIIRAKTDLDLEYLKNYFKSPLCSQEITRFENGAAQPNLSAKDLKQFAIPIPPLAEQKQIAAILEAADSLRQKDQQLVEHYTALSQSLFFEMFGDLTKSAEFQSVNAAEIIDIRDGTHDSPRYVSDGLPLITSKNIKNGDLDFSNVNFISQKDYEQIQKRSGVSLGDIIMPMIGTIGNPHLVTSEPSFAIKNVALYKFANSEKVTNIFIYYLLNSYYFDRYVSSKNKGGTQKFLSLGDLRKMPIPVPPVYLQNQFAERIVVIEQQKQQAQANLKKSKALFNSLLQRAFTGELTADKAA
jgi:type I restriction enzyme, S subunit